MRDNYLEEFYSFLRFPSVSTDDQYKEKLKRCADWLVKKLTSIGLETQLVPTKGHPIVWAHNKHQPGRRTVLIYGHYDVQPPDPLELWDSPPFEPVLKDGYVFARGATDNKGPDSFAHHRCPGDDRTKWRPPGEPAFGDRGRRGNRQRSPRRFSGGKSRCTEKRRGGNFRYRNDCAGNANPQLWPPRRNGPRNQGHWSENGFAFGRLWWRRCESDHCARAIIGHASRL